MQTETVNFIELDAQAVGAVRAGDAERYRELVERHERRVFAVAWSRLGDAALAEDVTQEAFIRAYRRLWLLGDGAKIRRLDHVHRAARGHQLRPATSARTEQAPTLGAGTSDSARTGAVIG